MNLNYPLTGPEANEPKKRDPNCTMDRDLHTALRAYAKQNGYHIRHVLEHAVAEFLNKKSKK